MAEKQPDWQRLRYPDAATFDRLVERYPDVMWDEEAKDYTRWVAVPAWIRLDWPSLALWDRAARTAEREEAKQRKERLPDPWPASKMAWADLLKVYPMRPGVRDDQQDLALVVSKWPDCVGQPMEWVEVTLVKDIITIGQLHYSRGRHRVPSSVAVDIRRINGQSTQELIKAMMPKEHREQIIATLSAGAA